MPNPNTTHVMNNIVFQDFMKSDLFSALVVMRDINNFYGSLKLRLLDIIILFYMMNN